MQDSIWDITWNEYIILSEEAQKRSEERQKSFQKAGID